MVPGVNDTEDLLGVHNHDRCHPRLEPCPRLRSGILEAAHRLEPVLVNAEPLGGELEDFWQPQQTRLVHCGPYYPPGQARRQFIAVLVRSMR